MKNEDINNNKEHFKPEIYSSIFNKRTNTQKVKDNKQVINNSFGSYDNAKVNKNDSFYDNFLIQVQNGDNAVVSSIAQKRNSKQLKVQEVKSNFANVQKVTIYKKGQCETVNKPTKDNQKDNSPVKIKSVCINDQPNKKKVMVVQEENVVCDNIGATTTTKKKLKIQGTKAPPSMINKNKKFFLCCIPINSKK